MRPHAGAGAVLASSVALVVNVCAASPAAAQSGTYPVPAVRAGLQSVPQPPLDTLEPAVAAQIRERFAALADAAGRLASEGDLAEACGRLAAVLHAYELVEAAEAAYLNAARLAPRDSRWHHLLGYLYDQTGRLEEAAFRYGEALRADARNRAAIARLGDVSLRLNRLAEARRHFEDVLDIFPALARNGLGDIALRERRFRDAIEHFRAALDLVPQASAIHYSLAMAYRGLGRLDDARAHLARRGTATIVVSDPIVDDLRTLVRGERGLVILGRRAFEAELYGDAADAFRQAIQDAPASVAARANLGLTLVKLGDVAGAIDQFEQALRLDPRDPVAHAGLGLVLAGQRRDSEATGHLQAAFDQNTGGVQVRRELMAAYLRLGRRDSAIAVLERARADHPDDEDTVVSLSILLVEEERYGEAIAVLDQAHQRFPDRTATATTLARLLASSPERSVRDGERALSLAMRVYASAPAPVHQETVAMALAELGRCREAMEWMRRAVAAAGQGRDSAEAARLETEMPRYAADPCTAPGR